MPRHSYEKKNIFITMKYRYEIKSKSYMKVISKVYHRYSNENYTLRIADCPRLQGKHFKHNYTH